jgi:hypothetical protein
MIFGMSWGVFSAYIVGIITVILSLITGLGAKDEKWNIKKMDD